MENQNKLITPEWITSLSDGEIFVFGSNLAGQHGGGAARIAFRKFGAEWGVGDGPTGRCYAIPTMHGGLEEIRPYVDRFLKYAAEHPEYRFLLTRVGCGIAGFRDQDMARLFWRALDIPNVTIPREWLIPIINEHNLIDQNGPSAEPAGCSDEVNISEKHTNQTGADFYKGLPLLGAIIGDIVGSRWEFNSTNNYNFELLSNKNSFTDDTICTIAVADALLHDKGYAKSIHRWCRKYPHPMGRYGGRFAKWISSDNPKPYGSFGNGSAMRVSPIAWYFRTLDEVREEARRTAICTHNHPEGIKGAVCVAETIFRFLQLRLTGCNVSNEDITCICNEVAANYNYDINSISRKMVENKFDETCQGTVPVALWITKQSHNFEDAVRKAVALGADADTLGAIVGGIAEAIWGIPGWLKAKALTYVPETMEAVIHDFGQAVRKRDKEAL